MPNWCYANVELSATEKEIKRLKKAVKDGNKDKATKGLLNALVAQPEFEGDQDWYSWNVDNWGTKWEVSSVNLTENDKTSFALSFDTAWGPALQAFQTWAEADPDTRTFTYKYYEPGMGFLGTATFSDGFYDDETVNHDDDNAEYRRIAEEEWGEDFSWEDEQEEDEEGEEDDGPTFAEEDAQQTSEAELKAALEDLKREFEALQAEQDPEYQFLKEDVDTLSRRIADYAARQESKTFKGEQDE